MNDVTTQWRGRVAVSGMGLVTPVGLSAEPALAALRAGVSRLESLEEVFIMTSDSEDEPVTGARVPILPDGLLGSERLKSMMLPAFHECLKDADVQPGTRLGVYLGTAGSSPAGRLLNYDDAMKQLLLDSAPDGVEISRAKLIQSGRASVQKAFRSAALALESGEVDLAVIGAVDSWSTPRALRWLKEQGRLPEYPRHTGNIPAEAAGFVALEPPASAAARGVSVYAHVVASAGRHEPAQLGEPNNGVALAQAMQVVSQGVEDAHAVIISDLDGERYRALEWVMAEPKGMWYYHTIDHWNPADCIGDSGAAMGAVMLAWASAALHKNYTGSERVLIWGASNEGAREALMVESAREAA